ncbi:vWA domain-containing protein [Bacillus sp. Brlt_9]|uniref:vWA domain-containing protein n=1 Tax=Bacillus sp. Brlt_9 TaxID=3110916 RepID=UPI003F7C0EA3
MNTKLKLTEEQEYLLNKRANNALQDNIYLMLKNHPFYSSLLSNFRLEFKINWIPVAAVTIEKGFPVRHTNPVGYLTYQRFEQIFIDIHEIIHITDCHHLRMVGKDPGLWNIATDIEINQLIQSVIAILPKDALMYYHFNLPKGLSAEEYYDILESRKEPITLPPELQNTLMNDIINGQNGQDGNGNGNQQQNNGGTGNSGPRTKSEKAPGFENLHPHWEEAASKNPELQKGIIQSMVRNAIIKNAGKIPGEMQEIIKRLFEAQLNWPELLSTFSQSLLTTTRRSTWSRPSRKYGKLKMGTLRRKELELLVGIDTSISLQEKEFMQFIAELDVMKDYAKITVVQIDTQIQSIETLNDLETEDFTIKGRGGTSFLPLFELATKGQVGEHFKLENRPDGIVYLTDGEGPAPDHCDIPTLWVLTPGGRKPHTVTGEEISWGQFAYLNE